MAVVTFSVFWMHSIRKKLFVEKQSAQQGPRLVTAFSNDVLTVTSGRSSTSLGAIRKKRVAFTYLVRGEMP